MKRLAIIVVALLLFISCSKENDQKQICNLADPINELPWLKEIKSSLTNCTSEVSIVQATYQSQTVFYTAITDPLFDGIQSYTLLNCEGKVVEIINADNMQNFLANISDVKNLYRCQK